jgi:hypothetical protein
VPEADLQVEPVVGGLVHLLREEPMTIPTFGLRPVHGGVRVLQEVGAGLPVVGVGRDADARRDEHLSRAEEEGLGQRVEDLAGNRTGSAVATAVLCHDDELVSSLSDQGVGVGDEPAQPLRDQHEELVTRVVAEGVVDGLEVVEVEEQGREAGASTRRPRERLLHPLVQEGAVAEARERVVVREVQEAGLGLLARRDVREDCDEVRCGTVGGQDGVDGQQLRVHPPGLVPVPHLAFPPPIRHEGPPHLRVERVIVPAGLEHAGGLPDRLGVRVAGHLRERAIDRDDPPARVGDHDPFAGGLEHRGGQPEVVLQRAALRRVADGPQEAAVSHRDRSYVGHDVRTVFSTPQDLSDALAGLQHLAEVGVALGLVAGRRVDQVRDTHTRELFGGVTVDPRRARVGVLDAGLRVHHDDGVVGALDVLTKLPLARAERPRGVAGKVAQQGHDSFVVRRLGEAREVGHRLARVTSGRAGAGADGSARWSTRRVNMRTPARVPSEW